MSIETDNYAFEVLDDPLYELDSNSDPEIQDTFGNYLRAVGKTALLNAEEEVELAMQIEAGLYAEKLLEASADKEHAYREQWNNLDDEYKTKLPLRIAAREGREAKQHMIAANLRLAVSMAKRYRGHDVPLDDLIQEGSAGLIRAVDGFDYKKGFKFSTYATWWVRQGITREMGNQRDNRLRLPTHIIEKQTKITSTRRAITTETGQEPYNEKVAELTGIDAKEINTIMSYGTDMVSLNMPVGGVVKNAILSDVLYDETEATVDEIIEHDVTREVLNKVLSQLDQRSERIVRLHIGLDGGRPMKMKEIAAQEGLSDRHVGVLFIRALKKLRGPKLSHELEDLIN